MTFEEYWNNLPDFYRSPFDNVKAAAEKAFNEATKIEREACAKLCERQNQAKPEHPEYGSWGEFNDCAELIRAR